MFTNPHFYQTNLLKLMTALQALFSIGFVVSFAIFPNLLFLVAALATGFVGWQAYSCIQKQVENTKINMIFQIRSKILNIAKSESALSHNFLNSLTPRFHVYDNLSFDRFLDLLDTLEAQELSTILNNISKSK